MKESKHTRAFRERQLQPGETVMAACAGYMGKVMGKGEDTQHNGALIVTDRRVAFYRKGWFGEIIETIPVRSITSIERRSLLGHYVVALHTSNDAMQFKSFDAKGEKQLIEAIETGRSA